MKTHFPTVNKFVKKINPDFEKNGLLCPIVLDADGVHIRSGAHRHEYFKDKYNNFKKLSIWQYVLLGWELPTMVFMEAVWRLIPWVIKEKESYINDSYAINKNMKNIEYPQYTKPQEIYWYKVPSVLLSWHDANIKKWKKDNEKYLD